MTVRNAFLPILLLFLHSLGSGAVAQPNNSWQRIANVPAGKWLVVESDGRKPIRGKLVAVSIDGLTVIKGSKTVAVPRDSISLVYLGKRTSRIKKTMIGALAGAGAGTLIGAAAAAVGKADPLTAAAGLLYGLPAGAVIGAAAGGRIRRGELIYQR